MMRGVPLTAVQRHWWSARQDGIAVRAEVAAVRVVGRIDDARLMSSIQMVVSQVPTLGMRFAVAGGVPQMIIGQSAPTVFFDEIDGGDDFCVERLRSDRDRPLDVCQEPLVRLHVCRVGPKEVVVALVTDPLVLDQRSAYLILGAVLRAYVGRLRTSAQRSFLDVATHEPPGHLRPGQRHWWLRRLASWQPGDRPGRGDDASRRANTSSRELRIDSSRWAALTGLVDHAGNSGWLSILAIITLWLRSQRGDHHAPVFTSTLDLRDYRGLGPLVGPMTDRLIFDVDLEGLREMSFADLARRVHAGLLDSVVHYVPYAELLALGRAERMSPPPRTGSPWDVVVHYCRSPLTSTTTRGEESLAKEGLSIELFRESQLAAGGPLGGPVEIHVAESGPAMAVVVNYDADLVEPAALDALLSHAGELLDVVLAHPTVPVYRLLERKGADGWTMTTAFSTG